MQLKRILLTGLLALLLPSLPALLSGCATPQKTVAFKSLKATALTVDAAMQAYADLVVRGQVDLTVQEKVESIYSKYQSAFKLAVISAKLDYASPSPLDVTAAANELITLISKLL